MGGGGTPIQESFKRIISMQKLIRLMRLFIAIELPEAVAGELKRLQNEIAGPGIRAVKDFHLTLKFLGEVQESQLSRIKKELASIKFNSFGAELTCIGVFPNPDRIRVIWAGLKAEEIYSLQNEIDLALEQLFSKEQDFHPHLTLARVSFLKDKAALKEKLDFLKPKNLKFDVKEFHLIKSTLTPQGPIYETLETFGS